jgi:hypothetical protein
VLAEILLEKPGETSISLVPSMSNTLDIPSGGVNTASISCGEDVTILLKR